MLEKLGTKLRPLWQEAAMLGGRLRVHPPEIKA